MAIRKMRRDPSGRPLRVDACQLCREESDDRLGRLWQCRWLEFYNFGVVVASSAGLAAFRGWGPATTGRTSAISTADLAIVPIWSIGGAEAWRITPWELIRPEVGFSPVVPVIAAGMRSEAASVPRAKLGGSDSDRDAGLGAAVAGVTGEIPQIACRRLIEPAGQLMRNLGSDQHATGGSRRCTAVVSVFGARSLKARDPPHPFNRSLDRLTGQTQRPS